jgi:hypothetical protein
VGSSLGPSGRGSGLMRHVLFDKRWHMWAAGAIVGDGMAMDTCEGDSGGPLLDAAGSSVMAITSWGVDCGDPDMPGVYAKLVPLMGPNPANYTLRKVRRDSPWQRGILGVVAAGAQQPEPDPAQLHNTTKSANLWVDDPPKFTVGTVAEWFAHTSVLYLLLVMIVLIFVAAVNVTRLLGPTQKATRARQALMVVGTVLTVLVVASTMYTYCA